MYLNYQVVCCRKDRDSGEYAQTYCKALNQTLLTQRCQGLLPHTFFSLKAYDTH